MKIYCNRQKKYDFQEVVKQFQFEDIWVRVDFPAKSTSMYIKFIYWKKDRDGEILYKYNYIYDWELDDYCNSLTPKEIDEKLSRFKITSMAGGEVSYPLETVATEELRETLEAK